MSIESPGSPQIPEKRELTPQERELVQYYAAVIDLTHAAVIDFDNVGQTAIDALPDVNPIVPGHSRRVPAEEFRRAQG